MAMISGYDSSSIGMMFSALNQTQNNKSTQFSGTTLLGIHYSDYETIRNGSYYKLLKAYYSRNLDQTGKNNAVSSNTATSKDDTKTLARIEDAAAQFQSAADALQTTGEKSVFRKVSSTDANGVTTEDYDREGIYKAIDQFAKTYNSMIDTAADSNTIRLLRVAKNMVNYSKVKENQLAKLGITIGADNTLSVNKEKLSEANVDQIKSMFQGQGSYGPYIQKLASRLDSYAKSEAAKANTYGKNGAYTYNYRNGEMYYSTV
ncbi:MAG: hypothetical protein PUB98_07790 [Clostridiales bacterium]|nr:hypothetical protein [Clostridiales bacterium]